VLSVCRHDVNETVEMLSSASCVTVCAGDQILIAKQLHNKYRSVTRRHARFFRRLRKRSEAMDVSWTKTKAKDLARMWTSGDRMQNWNKIGRRDRVMSEVGKQNHVGQRL